MAGTDSAPAAQLRDDLDAAFAWMRKLGVEIAPDRLGAYRKMAEKRDDFIGGRGTLGLRELAPIAATFGYEADAFIAIHRAFGGRARNELAALIIQLNLAAGGAARIDDARSLGARPARDALFRALTAAYLRQAIGNVTFGGAASVGFALGPHHIHVASGRVQPGGDMAANVTPACAQLLLAFDGRPGPRNRGVVALDASALITPPGQVPPAQERAAMNGVADQVLANFIDAQMDALQDALHGMDRRIVGVMLLSSSVVVAADDGAFVQVGRWVLVWREHISLGDFKLIDRLRGLLRGEG